MLGGVGVGCGWSMIRVTLCQEINFTTSRDNFCLGGGIGGGGRCEEDGVGTIVGGRSGSVFPLSSDQPYLHGYQWLVVELMKQRRSLTKGSKLQKISRWQLTWCRKR